MTGAILLSNQQCSSTSFFTYVIHSDIIAFVLNIAFDRPIASWETPTAKSSVKEKVKLVVAMVRWVEGIRLTSRPSWV